MVSCGIDGTILNDGNEEQEEGDDSKVEWFYLTAMIGFVVGFWGVCGPIFFNKSWRITYYLLLDKLWLKCCQKFNRF